MDEVRHEHDVGRRLLAELIEMQRRAALVPRPADPPSGHPFLRGTAEVVAVLVLTALFAVVLPVTLIH